MELIKKVLFTIAILLLAVVDLVVGIGFLLGTLQGEKGPVAEFIGFIMVAAIPALLLLRIRHVKKRVVICESCGWRGTLGRWQRGAESTVTVRRRGTWVDRTVGNVTQKQRNVCPTCNSDIYRREEVPNQPGNWRTRYLSLFGAASGMGLLILLVSVLDSSPAGALSLPATSTRTPTATAMPSAVTPGSTRILATPTPISVATITPTPSPIPALAASPTPATSGLVAWWSGDGDADDVVGGYAGTIIGRVGFEEGIIGLAFRFDGVSSYVEIPHAAELSLSHGSFTIDAWVSPTQSGGGEFRWIVDKSFGNGNLDYSFGLHTDGRLRFITRNLMNDILSPSVIPLDTFTHVAVVQDTGSNLILLYVDGEEIARADLVGEPVTNEAPLILGGRLYDAIRHPFSGQIDELRIYQRPLSLDEIQAVFNTQDVSSTG